MEWVLDFYHKQNAWSGVYEEEISQTNRENAALIEELAGPGPKRVLELGAGLRSPYCHPERLSEKNAAHDKQLAKDLGALELKILR